MAHIEVENFVSKFKSLVSAGVQVSLRFNLLNSEISDALEANLGSFPVETYSSLNNSPRRGPSYFRRQQRRKEEASGENAVIPSHEAEKVEDVLINETDEVNVKKDELNENNTPDFSPPGSETCAVAEEAYGVKKVDIVTKNGNVAEKLNKKKSDVAEEATVKKTDSGSIQTPTEYDAIVHGTAVIVGSPSSQVSNEIYRSIWGIVESKEHIKRNVGQIRVVNVRSTDDPSSKF